MTDYNIVEQYVDVGHFMRVERSDKCIGAGNDVSLLGDHLQEVSSFNDLGLFRLGNVNGCLCSQIINSLMLTATTLLSINIIR